MSPGVLPGGPGVPTERAVSTVHPEERLEEDRTGSESLESRAPGGTLSGGASPFDPSRPPNRAVSPVVSDDLVRRPGVVRG